jgi:hypothetical protein
MAARSTELSTRAATKRAAAQHHGQSHRWWWALVCLGCIVASVGFGRPGAHLLVSIEAEQSGLAQLYYDTGAGHSELQSIRVPYRAGSSRLRFALPAVAIRELRFDPAVGDRPVTLVDTRLLVYGEDNELPIDNTKAVALANVAALEQDGGRLRVVPVPGTNDPYIRLASDLTIPPPGFWGVLLDLARANGLFLALLLLFRASALRAITGPMGWSMMAFLAFGLILALATVSTTATSIHPDDRFHTAALNYYLENLLPPGLADPALTRTISLHGFSYLFELDVVYPIAGRVLSVLGVTEVTSTSAARFFNASLWLVLIATALRFRAASIGLIVLLMTPQVWYIFGYFNADALPLALSAMAAVVVSAENSSVNRFLQGETYRRAAVVAFALCLALLLLSKRNYLPLIPCFFLWLAVRHLHLRAYEAAAMLLGLGSSAVAYFLLSPMWGAPISGGHSWLVAGVLMSAFGGGTFVYRSCRTNVGRVKLRRLVTIAVLVLVLISPRVVLEYVINGGPTERKAAIAALQEQHAHPAFKASVIASGGGHPSMALIRKGVGIRELLGAPHRWAWVSYAGMFGVYGYYTVWSPDWMYFSLGSLLAALALCSVMALRRAEPQQFPSLLIVLAGGGALVLLNSLLHSWINDFQPQGRYLFGLLILIALALGSGRARIDRRPLGVILIAAFLLSLGSFVFVALPALSSLP